MQTRDELLAFIRERGLAELEAGGPVKAFTSVTSDLTKDWDGQLVGYRPPGFPKNVGETGADERTAMRAWIEAIR